MDTLEFDGHFWLPGQPDEKIAGILKFSPDSGGELRLIGGFETLDKLMRGVVVNTKRIIGRDAKKLYTLDNCLRTLGSVNLSGPDSAREIFHVGTVVEGVQYECDEPLECDRITILLDNLIYWLGRTGVKETMRFSEVDGKNKVAGYAVDINILPELTTRLACGKLSIWHRVSTRREVPRGKAFAEAFSVDVDFGGVVPLANAIDIASDIQDLVTIATDRVAPFEAVHYRHPDFAVAVSEEDQVIRPARLWNQWIAQPGKPWKQRPSDDDMVFTYGQLGEMDGIKRWMATAEKYRSQLGRVMNTVYNKLMFVQDVHLGRVAALESFHKKQSGSVGKMHLENRIKKLVSLAGDPFFELVPKRQYARWRRRVVDERNDVAHHLGRSLHQDLAELSYLSESVYWLFVLCMLRESAAPEECYAQLVKHKRFTWDAQNLQAML